MRLFVAADLPPGAAEELAGWARSGVSEAGLRRVPAAMLHVTLCFLGSRPASELDAACAAVESCVAQAHVGELLLGAPVWLPPRRPRVLALGVGERGDGLGALAAELRGELQAATGWPGEARRFHAHVTVARMTPRGAGDAAALREPSPALRFTPPSVTLYRSELLPEGPRYETEARFELLAAG